MSRNNCIILLLTLDKIQIIKVKKECFSVDCQRMYNMDEINHYQVLGVSRHARLDDIKKAFRRLAKACHPDRPGGGDQKRFQLLNEAYHTLADPQARARYDARLPSQPWPDIPRSGSSIVGEDSAMPWEEDLWDILREAGDDKPGELKPDAELDISSRDARKGGHLSLELPMTQACPACGGTGRGTVGLCPQCRGKRVYTALYDLELELKPDTKDGDIIKVPFEGAGRNLNILIKVQPD